MVSQDESHAKAMTHTLKLRSNEFENRLNEKDRLIKEHETRIFELEEQIKSWEQHQCIGGSKRKTRITRKAVMKADSLPSSAPIIPPPMKTSGLSSGADILALAQDLDLKAEIESDWANQDQDLNSDLRSLRSRSRSRRSISRGASRQRLSDESDWSDEEDKELERRRERFAEQEREREKEKERERERTLISTRVTRSNSRGLTNRDHRRSANIIGRDVDSEMMIFAASNDMPKKEMGRERGGEREGEEQGEGDKERGIEMRAPSRSKDRARRSMSRGGSRCRMSDDSDSDSDDAEFMAELASESVRHIEKEGDKETPMDRGTYTSGATATAPVVMTTQSIGSLKSRGATFTKYNTESILFESEMRKRVRSDDSIGREKGRNVRIKREIEDSNIDKTVVSARERKEEQRERER
eukprot:Ihof_evm1s1428 gene=Ihof_evmTU1s1428